MEVDGDEKEKGKESMGPSRREARDGSLYPRSRSRSRNSNRNSPQPPLSGGGITLNRPLGYSTLPRSGGGGGGGGGVNMSFANSGPPSSSKMFMSTRRSSSGIFITNMFGSRFRHLQKLHSDAFCLGLNAVCYPGLPMGTMFRSSLPATPVSTPIHREAFTQFTEQAIRDRLCQTPSPRKNRGFSPLSFKTDDPSLEHRSGSRLADTGSRCSESEGEPQPMDITCPSTPITEPVLEAAQEVDSPNQASPAGGDFGFSPIPPDEQSSNKPPLPPNQRKLFVGNISYRLQPKDLIAFFKQFGKIEDCCVVKDHIKHISKGYGFVTFYNEKDAQKVISCDQSLLVIDNRQLRVFAAQPKTVRIMKSEIQEKADQRLEESSRLLEESVEATDRMKRSLVIGNQKGSKRCHINDLVDDALLLIFSHVWNIIEKTSCERVCKRWNSLLKTSWESSKSLEFAPSFYCFGSPALTTRVLCSILKKCPNLRTLDLESVTSNLDTKAFEIIASSCLHLTEANLAKAPITDYGLRVLSDKCSNLRNVKLNNCYDFGEKGLWWLIKNCQSLESLEVSNNGRVTGKCFRLLGDNIKKLNILSCVKLLEGGFEELTTRNGRNIEDLATGPMASNEFDVICSKMKRLRILDVVVEDDLNGFSKLGQLKRLEVLKVTGRFSDCYDKSLVYLLRDCPQLRVLNLSDAPKISDDGIKEAVKYCPLIEELALPGSKLTDIGMNSIASLSCIRSLDVNRTDVSDIGVKAILEFCPQIRSININFCLKTTTDVIAFAINSLKSKPYLGPLIFNYCSRKLRVKDTTLVSLQELDEEDLDYPGAAYFVDHRLSQDDDNVNNDTDFLEVEDPMEEDERNWIS